MQNDRSEVLCTDGQKSPYVRAVRTVKDMFIRNGKRVQANGRAKNHVIIMPDAEVNTSVDGIMGGAFGCAGERCMAIATAVCVGDASKTVLPELVNAANHLKVGPTDRDPQPQMGPVITREHCNRVKELITEGEDQGGKVLSDGRGLKIDEAPDGFFDSLWSSVSVIESSRRIFSSSPAQSGQLFT